jgi:hypothetical protein
MFSQRGGLKVANGIFGKHVLHVQPFGYALLYLQHALLMSPPLLAVVTSDGRQNGGRQNGPKVMGDKTDCLMVGDGPRCTHNVFTTMESQELLERQETFLP